MYLSPPWVQCGFVESVQAKVQQVILYKYLICTSKEKVGGLDSHFNLSNLDGRLAPQLTGKVF